MGWVRPGSALSLASTHQLVKLGWPYQDLPYDVYTTSKISTKFRGPDRPVVCRLDNTIVPVEVRLRCYHLRTPLGLLARLVCLDDWRSFSQQWATS